MTKGSCLCGALTYTYNTSTPVTPAICHCLPCQKTAGPRGSTNLIIPEADFHPKPTAGLFNYTRKGDSGKSVTYNNCKTCGTIVYVEVEAMPDIRIVKMGTLDDEAEMAKRVPGMEIYTKDRVAWCPHFGEAVEKEGGS
ncbi:hypothetical protein MBLNU230_g5045t1 [Neophaeotheca triangularis]